MNRNARQNYYSKGILFYFIYFFFYLLAFILSYFHLFCVELSARVGLSAGDPYLYLNLEIKKYINLNNATNAAMTLKMAETKLTAGIILLW